ncbi:MAG: recombination-associated protein RdgC [Candidatus Sumerlaeia bacterium]
MPISSGNISCRAYSLMSKPAPDFMSKLGQDLKRHAFQPVRPERSPRSMGWVSPRDVLDTDLATEKAVFDDFIMLGLRVDKVAVNTRILKAHFQQAVQKTLKERDRKQLTRDEKAAIMEKTRVELMLQQTPSTSFYEMAWNLENHHVYFSATASTVNTDFCDLFQETFHVGLTPMFPYLRAEEKATLDGSMDVLLQSGPARFNLAGGVE